MIKLEWIKYVIIAVLCLGIGFISKLTVDINQVQTQTQYQSQNQIQAQSTLVMGNGEHFKGATWVQTNIVTGIDQFLNSLPYESAIGTKLCGFNNGYTVFYPVYTYYKFIQTNNTIQSNTQKGITNKIKIKFKLFGGK